MNDVAFTLSRALNIARWHRPRHDRVQRTPDALFRQLDAEFHFTLDAASSDANAKCERHLTVEDDALGRRWAPERVWLNPPYGKGLREWMRKAWEESRIGALVVCLVPSQTDADWWHDYAMRADEVRFIRGRVAFHNESKTRLADIFWPMALLVFRPAMSGEKESLL